MSSHCAIKMIATNPPMYTTPKTTSETWFRRIWFKPSNHKRSAGNATAR